MTAKFKEGDELILYNGLVVTYVGPMEHSDIGHVVKNKNGTFSVIHETYLKKKPKTKTVMMQDWVHIAICSFVSRETQNPPLNEYIWKKVGPPYQKTFEVPE